MTNPRTRNRVLLGVAASGLTALLAACGSGGYGSSTGATTTPAPTKAGTSATRVTAVLTDFHIQLPTHKYRPGQYTFTAENKGQHQHALELVGPGGSNRSKTLNPGQSTALTLTLKSGTYQVFCPIGGHRDLGMNTKIAVGGTPAPSGSGNTTSPRNGY
ncbi:plastocyanin/azurin family copper-binding protein [Streptomyces turgidiscabies]|uniref:Plastocyanin n=1 Tax=Streptomyces turgidiscabies TaxID=85558 RepID=A0ABU0RV09_9ACTN|nr:plastocyanin/azurin family copper-binding protein [Streptomyces turgidiscabies]MDQ0935791.1 plastocyanin [Streptomyces turgidiscabies]